MINDVLTIKIDDALTDSTINIKLPKELMHKLYRIKEINKYDTLFEYNGYNAFCDAIKDNVHEFHILINNDYYNLMELVEQGKLDNDIDTAIKCMDSLITKGYTYEDAFKVVSDKFFKK